MASLVLGTLGNTALPGFGGILGSAAGSLIDSAALTLASRALGGHKNQHQQPSVTFGQHITDVYLTGSSEGAPIRKLWGRMRLGGNVIWASKFREWQENKVNWSPSASAGKGLGGGGGGGSIVWQPSVTVIYHANLSFAVAFCEGGPATALGRVWANGKEIDLNKYTWRFYNGSDQQLPDSFIESIEGVGNVPAYRGICYLVFEDMVLDEFGNTMPQITAEIIRSPVVTDPDDLSNCLRSVCIIPGLGEFAYGTQIYKASDGQGNTWPINANVFDQRPDFLFSLDQFSGANELPAVAPPAPPLNLPWGGNPDPPTGGNWSSSLGAVSAPNAMSLIVSWFGTDLRAGNCQIVPKVEVRSENVSPVDWRVGGYARNGNPLFGTSSAPLVTQIDPSLLDPYGNGGAVAFSGRTVPAFGGTPSDDTVLQAVAEIRRRGLRCVFYPFVTMDIPSGNGLPDPYGGTEQAAFPWRGRITCHPAPGQPGTVDQTPTAGTQIAAFFAQYRAMVLHYANLFVHGTDYAQNAFNLVLLSLAVGNPLLAQYFVTAAPSQGGANFTQPTLPDAFIIGSEFVGLTKIRTGPGDADFPFVDSLRSLAAEVRSIVGSTVKIGYAADWSEYHSYRPSDGTNDVIFNLDPLWVDKDIDFIGIDNYMPLSDWRDFGPNADYNAAGPISPYDKSYLKANVEGGEDYAWYYASNSDRVNQIRTPIVDSAYGKHWVFRQKDIRNWWANAHKSRPGGVENGSSTVWIPQSKPIWFTEFGCPAVDKGANQPNVFIDPKSSESFLPYFSNGTRDDAIQRAFVEALVTYWRDNSPVSAAGIRMLDPANMFAWAWDARPFPDFPARASVWRDSPNYELGHWLNGRANEIPLRFMIAELCASVGVADFDTSGLVGPGSLVIGYAADGVVSPRGILEGLQDALQFDAVESGGKVLFQSRAYAPTASISDGSFVLDGDSDVGFAFTRAQETDLPGALELSFVDAYANYASSTATARRSTATSNLVATASVPAVLETTMAQGLAQVMLQQQWAARESGQIKLPPSQAVLDAGDCLFLTVNGVTRSMRIRSVDIGAYRGIALVGFDPSLARSPPVPVGQSARRSAPAPTTWGPPIVEFMDIPVLNADDPKPWAPRIAAYAKPWSGVSIYRAAGASFQIAGYVSSPSIMGELTSPLYSGPRAIWDMGNSVYVRLYDTTNQILSLTEAQTLGGLGAVAIKNAAASKWEFVQFVHATLTGAGTYKLSRLLRAQLGTEGAMADPVPAGSRVVFLDSSALGLLEISQDQRDIAQTLRWGPSIYPSTDNSYAQADFVFEEVGLRPWSVSQVTAARQSNGDVALSWVRRTRFNGDPWDPSEVPLNEASESYDLEVLKNGVVVRTFAGISAPTVTYTLAMQTADFGASQSFYAIRIYQNSAQIGRGQSTAKTVYA